MLSLTTYHFSLTPERAGYNLPVKVTFTRTKQRGYSLTVEGPDIATAIMDPAPGYHARLPHDVAHFIVENELGIEGGIFGQMAQGGILRPADGGARVQRKAKKKRDAIFKANTDDALFSEHAVYAAQSRWEKHDIIPDTKIPQADLDRVIAKFDEFAAQWSELPVGGSISLDWSPRRRKHER
jgi:hypothetical protein